MSKLKDTVIKALRLGAASAETLDSEIDSNIKTARAEMIRSSVSAIIAESKHELIDDAIVTHCSMKMGDPLIELNKTKLFAEQRSIGQKELYQAQTSGVQPEIKFIILDYMDYSGQEYLIHEDVRYKILRT